MIYGKDPSTKIMDNLIQRIQRSITTLFLMILSAGIQAQVPVLPTEAET